MHSVTNAIRDRRSVRAFLDKPVPAATIWEILELAALSPSSSNMQPWRIYALSGPVLAELKVGPGRTFDGSVRGEEAGRVEISI